MLQLTLINSNNCVLTNLQCEHKDHHPECPSTQSPSLDVLVNVEDCYIPRSLMSEEASEETGAENDVSEETKKSDRITAKDLKFSLSIGNEEQEASEKLRYTNFPAQS